MKAGRELDALVAEKVMGVEPWSYPSHDFSGECVDVADSHHGYSCTRCAEFWLSCCEDEPHGPCEWSARNYSTSIASAWEVVEKMLRSWWIGVDIRQSFMGTSVAFLPHPCSHPEPKDAVATVDPRDVAEDCEPEDPRVVALAICLAALRAVGVEVPDEA